MKFIQVFVTVNDRLKAEEIAVELVKAKLAVCAQVLGPIYSTYRWDGRIENSMEWMVFIKTVGDKYPLLETKIKEMHPYEVPEIIAHEIKFGNPAYLNWIEKEVGEEKNSQ